MAIRFSYITVLLTCVVFALYYLSTSSHSDATRGIVGRPDIIDVIYGVKHGVKLPLRIYPHPEPSNEPRPWLLHTHGGAWAAGQPFRLSPWVIHGFREKGYHIVSVAYRLSPQVGLSAMVEDCLDAFKWCRTELAKTIREEIESDRYAITGESAGGTLSTLLGHHLNPPPRAVIDVYGVTSFPDFYHVMSARPKPKGWSGLHPEIYLEQFMHDRDLSNAVPVAAELSVIQGIPEHQIQEQWRVNETLYSYTERQKLQSDFKAWADQHFATRTIPNVCEWKDGASEDENEAAMKAVSSLHLLDDKRAYPPTAFLHGSGDTVVPIEQSEIMAARLTEMEVEVLERYCPGAGHGFDAGFLVS